MSADTLDVVAGVVSLALTLMVLSYLLGDNPLYRLAVHILVGTTAGYVVVVAFESVILPWLDVTLLDDDADETLRALGIIPFMLMLALLVKNSPRYNLLRRLGNLGIAFLVGVGTAVALVGAISGTIVPLTRDAGLAFENHEAFNAAVMTVGTISTLVYFQYLARRRVDGVITRTLPMRVLAGIGQLIVAITFGAIYASALLTSLHVFDAVISKQLTFLLEQIG